MSFQFLGLHPWSDDEHQRFLQGLEKFGSENAEEAWQKIADHVGTRTIDDIKLHANEYFLRLQNAPFEGKPPYPLSGSLPDDPWTAQDDAILENSLAVLQTFSDEEVAKVVVPRKSAEQVLRRWRSLMLDISNIEGGKTALPLYANTYFTPKPMAATDDMADRKSTVWTEEEHRLFLLGLMKFGKGDWRSMSRHYVISRTPSQVAAHSQRYHAVLQNLDDVKITSF
eukprot:Rmarinus@m.17872